MYKLPGAAKRFARNDFAALPAICKRWSPNWKPDPSEFEAVRASFSHSASLNAAFGYYRKLSPIPSASLKTTITVPTVVFAGLDDPGRRARRLSARRPDVHRRLHRRRSRRVATSCIASTRTHSPSDC